VEALCPNEHPLHTTRAVQRFHLYSPLSPLRALSTALDRADPGLIVPCDDRALGHVLSVQAKAPLSPIGELVTSCIAPIGSHVFLQQRGAFMGLAQELGLRAPDMQAVESATDIGSAVATLGLPLVLKSDGSWGGMGVIVAHTQEEAETARRKLLRRAGLTSAIQSLLLKRDPYRLMSSLNRTPPQIYAQRFVHGRPANVAAVGWKGECLASIQMEALLTRNAFGASTVLRTIDRPDMAGSAEALIRHLNISGFCGFDFMIEDGTGDAHLIELNPRATPTSHLALGHDGDLVAALDTRLRDQPLLESRSREGTILALFPDAWQHAPHSAYLKQGQHDVPWQEPELVRELIRIPYPDRGAIARRWSICRA
jgi:predicted ATP-grasp superfamily ATP-dependent carboligase